MVLVYPLTKEECLKMGGHCFEEMEAYTMSTPQTLLVSTRICKHCGHKQEGNPQSPLNKGG